MQYFNSVMFILFPLTPTKGFTNSMNFLYLPSKVSKRLFFIGNFFSFSNWSFFFFARKLLFSSLDILLFILIFMLFLLPIFFSCFFISLFSFLISEDKGLLSFFDFSIIFLLLFCSFP